MHDVPHSSEQLYQASVAKGQADYQTGRTQTPCSHVDQAQDEGCQGEGAQAQGRWVGDTTVLDLLVETGLEFSSEGRQALFTTGRVDMSERTVAEASGSFGGLVFLVGHFTVHAAGAVGFFVVVVGGVASEFGVGLGGHCDGEEIFKRPRGVEMEVRLVGGLNRSVSRVATGRQRGEGGYIVISEEMKAVPSGRSSVLKQDVFETAIRVFADAGQKEILTNAEKWRFGMALSRYLPLFIIMADLV